MDPAAGGVQRVQNWMTRGIPSAVKWDFREVFAEQSNDLQKTA